MLKTVFVLMNWSWKQAPSKPLDDREQLEDLTGTITVCSALAVEVAKPLRCTVALGFARSCCREALTFCALETHA